MSRVSRSEVMIAGNGGARYDLMRSAIRRLWGQELKTASTERRVPQSGVALRFATAVQKVTLYA